MLSRLHIDNIAVIERADVEFSTGLNVLSGETGAGKSVIIDSINAVLGCRTSRELIRTGCESAGVTATFFSPEGLSWCRENEIDAEDDEIVLQRKLSADGKSSARVNGVPVSASQLRDLGIRLLDIHGQNDGRQLLDEKRHLQYLDNYGVSPDSKADYAEKYSALRQIQSEMKRLKMDDEEKLRREESLRFRIAELEKAEIRPGEEEEITARRDMLRNSEKLTEALQTALEALSDGEASAVSLCGDGEYAVSKAAGWSPDLSETEDLIRSSRLNLEDASERLREKLEELDFSPEEYDRLEERISLLHRLEKKYFTDEQGLADMLASAHSEMEELEYAGDRLLQLEKLLTEARKAAVKSAGELTLQRKAAAEKLQKQVEDELRDLNMPSVRFFVSVAPREGENSLDATGGDDVVFTMSANAGEAPGPIHKIASGGELSRIMLALKNVFAEKDTVDALIFDEIDTGVSGVAAQRVAEKLAALSKSKQVLCVTHLPQLAAMADNQYLVYKNERDGRTYTRIDVLDFDGRCREIARINGGDALTDTMLQGAAELLHRAEDFRSKL